jgi:hypothetical protein
MPERTIEIETADTFIVMVRSQTRIVPNLPPLWTPWEFSSLGEAVDFICECESGEYDYGAPVSLTAWREGEYVGTIRPQTLAMLKMETRAAQ